MGNQTERRVWPHWAVLVVRLPLMAPLVLLMAAGEIAQGWFDWLDRHLPARVAEYRPRPIRRTG